jgi:hypothetical protein
MRKLDWEKGITIENPLVPPKSEEDQAVQAEAEAANASAAQAAKGKPKCRFRGARSASRAVCIPLGRRPGSVAGAEAANSKRICSAGCRN